MFLEHRKRTFQGTFHAIPDYVLRCRWSEMQRDLSEIPNMHTRNFTCIWRLSGAEGIHTARIYQSAGAKGKTGQFGYYDRDRIFPTD